MSEPTPHEIASLAALLASEDKKAIACLSDAVDLWKAAAEYLVSGNQLSVEWMLKTQGYTTYTFDQILKLLPSSPARGNKKGRTMLGSITTKQGLIKAIRRLPPDKAKEIEQRECLYQYEIDAIIAEQARRNKVRTNAAAQARKIPVKTIP